jgi:hypothetical protein
VADPLDASSAVALACALAVLLRSAPRLMLTVMLAPAPEVVEMVVEAGTVIVT